MSKEQSNNNDPLAGFFIGLFSVFLTWLITTLYTSGTFESQTNRSICQQLYKYSTDSYINCNSKGLSENIRLIEDISK
jgi:hypothetical protein